MSNTRSFSIRLHKVLEKGSCFYYACTKCEALFINIIGTDSV